MHQRERDVSSSLHDGALPGMRRMKARGCLRISHPRGPAPAACVCVAWAAAAGIRLAWAPAACVWVACAAAAGVRLARAGAARVRVAGAALLVASFGASCARFGPVYPPRPAAVAGAPLVEPQPARVMVHVSVTRAALDAALEEAVPRSGDGEFALLGAARHYVWDRGPLEASLSQGRVELTAVIHAWVSLPVKSIDVPLRVRVKAEPVVSAAYALKLQSVDVEVTSEDTRVAIAERLAGVYETIAARVDAELKEFTYDLRPAFAEAYARLQRPIAFALGDATACVDLRVLEIEAAPTVLADGLEKDVAIVLAPAMTLPCTAEPAFETAALPELLNVGSLPAGPFTVTVPIAAAYDELTRAMTAAFTGGKLFFSPEYPTVYLEKPELYEAQGQLVLKLHIAGPVHKFGFDTDLDGDLFLSGHPAVVDDELSFPDLEPTIETRNFLLSLKAMTGGDRIRDEARRALRIDLGARLRDARDKLGKGLTFGSDRACFQADVDRVEVTGVYPHAGYLRVYVAVTARARLAAPCPSSAPVAWGRL